MLHLRVQLFPPGHLLNCAVLPEEHRVPARHLLPWDKAQFLHTVPAPRSLPANPSSGGCGFPILMITSCSTSHLRRAGSMRSPPEGQGVCRSSHPESRGLWLAGCPRAVWPPHVPEGGDCFTSVLSSEFFVFFSSCNSGFSLPQLSEPGKLPLVVPNAAPLGLLVLSVKPWQRRSPSGLQKPCRIWGLPGRWALLRAVTPLTAPDSSQTCFLGLTGV